MKTSAHITIYALALAIAGAVEAQPPDPERGYERCAPGTEPTETRIYNHGTVAEPTLCRLALQNDQCFVSYLCDIRNRVDWLRVRDYIAPYEVEKQEKSAVSD